MYCFVVFNNLENAAIAGFYDLSYMIFVVVKWYEFWIQKSFFFNEVMWFLASKMKANHKIKGKSQINIPLKVIFITRNTNGERENFHDFINYFDKYIYWN